MIKLNSVCEKLEIIKEELEENICKILDRADSRDRDLTEKEEERIEALQEEIDSIDNALDYLSEYCS